MKCKKCSDGETHTQICTMIGGSLYPYYCENGYQFNNDTNGCLKDDECQKYSGTVCIECKNKERRVLTHTLTATKQSERLTFAKAGCTCLYVINTRLYIFGVVALTSI